MSAIAGRVLLIPKGAYNALTLYAMLDVVSYNGNSYVAKKSTQGNTPSADTEYWMILASGTAVASINDIGDVLITSATNGQVLKYDATRQRWVNGDDTGGLLPHLVITSETGATVTVVKGGDTITTTETSTGVYECDVPEFGTYTCHSLLNGDDVTITVNVDTVKVYNISNAHFSATITVTFPENSTCSCGKAGETPQTASVSPHTFTVHSTGTYTVSSTDGTSTASSTVSIVTDGQTESVTLSYVPDGSTVTPTDDIQIWLNCGNIWDKAYTTLGEVLADSTTLSALMASNNAVDYLVRSKTWADGICQNLTAMSYIGLNNYCANTLLADSTWRNAIGQSEYKESVLNVKVPILTSEDSRIIYSTYTTTWYPHYAFDGNGGDDNWASNVQVYGYQDTHPYIGFDFTRNVKIVRVDVTRHRTDNNFFADYKVQHSDEANGTWNDIYAGNSGGVSFSVIMPTYTQDSCWRVYSVTEKAVGSNVRVVEVQFYGREDI